MAAATFPTVLLAAALQQAAEHHQAGRLPEAEQLYRALLQVRPDYPDANHNLGVLLGQAAGLPYLKTALEGDPTQGQYWLSYAEALLACGQAGEALIVIETAMQCGLDTPAAQRLRQAAIALTDNPGALDRSAFSEGAPPADLPQAEREQLVALFNAGRHAEMESLARLLIERHPRFGFAWKGLGAALQMQGKDALAALQKATELLPDDDDAHNNLGNALRDRGQLEAALASYTKALEMEPGFAEAHYNLGNVLQDLGRPDGAVASYRRALELKPDFAAAHGNLGVALKDCGLLDDAAASCRRALEIKPDFADAHNNLGNVLKDLGQLDGALASYRRALECDPGYTKALGNLLFIHNYLADQPVVMLLAEARRFGELVARQAHPYTVWCNVPAPERCLRVGLVSGDLRNHPVGYFLESLLAALASHASGRLEMIAYSNHARSDALTERLKASCHGWHSVAGLSDASLAQQIRDDGIDILIDLAGHTAYNRLPLFAWKPAPVQASWLGYFATTGVAAMDYFIADPWTAPEAEESHFIEKIQRLPQTYLCFSPPDVDVPVAPLPALAERHITFGCFNHLTKMNDAVVALWARVLLAVPGSHLFLKTRQLGEATVRHSVVARFAAHGIAAERLILESAAPRAELLAAYRRVDIALDPFPYPGGATSIEALWMGAPVLTLAGERFLSHIGASIMHNAGLPAWIAADADDYIARAASHAGDLQRLATLRNGLRQQVLASPLFDAPRFARHFEIALREMWRNWCYRQPGQSL
ncbi:MAG: tetratricopeptide repeat protein [Sulfuricellaceae bacterium]